MKEVIKFCWLFIKMCLKMRLLNQVYSYWNFTIDNIEYAGKSPFNIVFTLIFLNNNKKNIKKN